MTLSDFKHRLLLLESKSGSRDAVLIFADGSTRSLRIPNPLGVFCDAMNRVSWRIGPGESGTRREDDTRKFFLCEGAARPVSEFDPLIDIIGHAAEVQSEDIFISGLVHQLCREACEKQLEIKS